MKKLLLATTATTFAFSAAASFAQDMQPEPKKITVESITQRVEQRLVRNPNLKLDSVTEKDGKFTVRITTKDGSLVEEKIIDPANKKDRGGFKMMKTPLTTERVKEMLEGHLAAKGNPNLKVGDVTEEGGNIRATIVTQDGSLVKEGVINAEKPMAGFAELMDMGMRGKGHHGKMMDGKMMDGKMMGRRGGSDGQAHHGGKDGPMGGKMGGKMMGQMQPMDGSMGDRMMEEFKNMSPEQQKAFVEKHQEMMQAYEDTMNTEAEKPAK
ncbi:MAG: hypothetical protein ACK5MJ_04000 [Alphaproteobacteria bacterium]